MNGKGIWRAVGCAVCCLIGWMGWAWESPKERRGGSDRPPASEGVRFSRDIRPILAAKCWPCHGSDHAALAKTGNMRLDSFEGATSDRGGYRAITPGDLANSYAWKRITSKDSPMPPAEAGVPPLTDAEKELIARWIREGARYEAHWSFVPLATVVSAAPSLGRGQVPTPPMPPPVSDPKWNRNPIDRFVYARLAQAQMKPEPRADRATLLRRVTLTLTGLPPTSAELDAFLADTTPQAYERVVDRLLASPAYGEHQARYWLDAVRYGDTHGLHIDNERSIFPYRDWVVRAFNRDLPYDQFTIWQLAGDLLKNPTTEQLIATGYVRMNPTTNEGGVIEEEFLVKNTYDRVDTTATVFLGVTLGCAKCHDHKYDPFTQRDYFRLFAFFNSTADAPLDGNLKLHEPVMKAPTPAQERSLREMESRLDAMRDRVPLEAARSWISEAASRIPVTGAWEVSGPYESPNFDSAFATAFAPESGETNGLQPWRPIPFPSEEAKTGVVGKENAAAYLRTSIRVEKASSVTIRLGSDDAIRVWLNGKLVHDNKALRSLAPNQDEVKLDLLAGENRLLIKVVNASGPDGAFFGMGDLAGRRIVEAGALCRKGALSVADRRAIASTFLELGPASESALAYRKQLAQYNALDAQIPMTYIAKELPKPRPAFILRRGEYNLRQDQVDRGVPAVLGPWPDRAPKNRLGLARWLVDPRNPLTARVFVNRIWQQHFGTGIVSTAEDFGNRGAWPTHPELLDYLAARFVSDGWSIKRLHKLIVMSEAFRQSSRADATKRAKDPTNALISRGPRFRLDAEVIRDSALAISGLLVDKPGGRGDKPYQPPGLWEIIAFQISDTSKYVQDHGEALYRRSLYMFWKRTSPPATMLIFDAPMRESCVVTRSRTNTPTQALATLNDPQFFEAARVLAQRILLARRSDKDRALLAFRLATARRPNDDELEILLDSLRAHRSTYQANPKSALDVLAVGEYPRDPRLDPTELAAWTLVCNAILNLDETLTQH